MDGRGNKKAEEEDCGGLVQYIWTWTDGRRGIGGVNGGK